MADTPTPSRDRAVMPLVVLAVATAVVAGMTLFTAAPGWAYLAVFVVTWIAGTATMSGSTIIRFGTGLLIAMGAFLCGSFLLGIFVGAGRVR